jgi:hypothetical protein
VIAKAQIVATPSSPLTSGLLFIPQPISLFHRTWPVAVLTSAVIVNLAWVGFLGYRFIERVLVVGNDLVREFPGTDKLSSMKTSQQIRVLMNGHRLGPEHGHHKSKVVEDIIRLFKSYGLLIRSNDTLAKAVRREYDGRRIASKLPLGF